MVKQQRHQRDYPRVMAFIQAHALLNCFNREKKEGTKDTITAIQKDTDAGFTLYKKIEESNELGLSPFLYKIYRDVIAPLLRPDEGIAREDILKKFYQVRHKSLNPQVLKSDILPQLEAVGLI